MIAARSPRYRRAESGKPGFEGRLEIAPATVENPYQKGEFEPVVRNIRESTLATMHSRRQIDDAQKQAGDWLRAQWERMRMGSGAIDPSYEPVDTSGHADPIPDRFLMAAHKLQRARIAVSAEVGWRGWFLIECICCEGCSIAEAAGRRYGGPSRDQAAHTGRLFREALDVLAGHLGYSSVIRSS